MKKVRKLFSFGKSLALTLMLGTIMLGGFLANASMVLAADTTTPATTTPSGVVDPTEMFGDLDSGKDFADIAGLGSQDLATTIASIIRVMLGFLGVVAVCLIIFGGFKWMVAGGKEEQVKKAQNLIIYGVIGIVIVLAAYAIASFVLDSITSALGS